MNSNTPIPIYDSIQYLKNQILNSSYSKLQITDFNITKEFLLQYDGSEDSFNAYRRELERLTQWSWLIQKQSIITLTRENIEEYIKFCQKPPKTWIATKNVARFKIENSNRIANTEWRPFVATISKADVKNGKTPNKDYYKFSQNSLKELFAITSSFYNYLVQIELRETNPLLQIRQKNKYLQKTQKGIEIIRRLSTLQWDYTIETAEQMAKNNPEKHERTYFIMTLLYGMYLRISELVETPRWQPKMNDFYRDHDGLWWFKTVGKGNKMREISVSDAVITSLKRWRTFLSLSPLPTIIDTSPLLPKGNGNSGLSDQRHVRSIVQECFDLTIERLQKDGFKDDALELQNATVHWLRHTGISDDVKIRPREHVRDDAGHSSGAITDRYINIERRERHATAKKKPIKQS